MDFPVRINIVTRIKITLFTTGKGVRQICYEEGKSIREPNVIDVLVCIVVYFDTLPEKFTNLEHNISSPSSSFIT